MATINAWSSRRALALVGLMISALTVSGCGFTPLYATPGVSAGLSSIDVVVPQGRVAYLLREDLDDALAHDKNASPVWRLDLSLATTRDPRGLRIDNVAERYELGVTVRYTLTAVATGQVAHSGEVTTAVSYDAADAAYAGIAARQDSQERVASDAARRIQIELAAWLAHGAGH
jgi:LPS-assembly lipoprotein